MSVDKKVSKDLMETLEDGKKGFEQAAEKLDGNERSDVAATLREFSSQRASFSKELEGIAAAYGDDIDESGSMAAAAHRGWIALKDALTGSDPEAILAAVETGEDHAVSEYQKALDEDISPELRSVVQRQAEAVQQAHVTVKSFRDAA